MEIWNDWIKLKIQPLNGNAAKVFQETVKRISKYKYWISAGTLLGLYRDGDFIKGDTDLDFAFIGHDGIEKEIGASLEGYELVRTVVHNGKPMQLAFAKDDVLVDLYIHYLEGDNYVNYSESGKQIMPKEIYDNAQVLSLKYGLVKTPHPIDKYLTIRYGDWKTPRDSKPHFEKI